MEFFEIYKSEYAVLIVRLIAGILFFAQGYDKVFRIHLQRTATASADALRPLGIPDKVVRFTSIITSIIEFAGGLFLIAGLWILPVTWALLLVLLPVTFAMSWREPMWNMQHVWVRLVMLVFLLLVSSGVHLFSVDHLIGFYAD